MFKGRNGYLISSQNFLNNSESSMVEASRARHFTLVS